MIGTYGIMAIDPGGSTGVAWGRFDKNADSVKDALSARWYSSSTTIEGSVVSQILQLSKIWRKFYGECVNSLGIPPNDVHLCVEDFNLAGSNRRPKAGEDPLISVKIAWGLWGYRSGQAHEHERWGGVSGPVYIHWQTPSQAKSYATDTRLKEWGVYVRGSTHERDAWRHIAFRIAELERQRVAHPSRVRARAHMRR